MGIVALTITMIATPVGLVIFSVLCMGTYFTLSWMNGFLLEPMLIMPIGGALLALICIIFYAFAKRLAKKLGA